MYDFLDKIGLKAVLEAIKGKIPTSLPANGGNADTVGGKSPSDFVEALTIQQTSYTRILIPDNVDVKSWLIENAKIGTIYYVTSECQGQINLPPMTAYGWAWFLFDGIRYVSKVMVSNVSARYYLLDHVNIPGDWKEISTTPIKTDTITSNSDGAGYVWLPQGNGRKYISAIAHAYARTNMYIDGTTGNTNLQIPDAINSAVTIDIAWIE